jgi:hypothetical protein
MNDETDIAFIAYLQGYEAGRDAIKVERDRYKAGLDDAIHLLMNHNHHADPEWVSGYEDLCNRYSKIKEG